MLHEVTGPAAYCGPTVLSAVTGKPTDTWPSGSMAAEDMAGFLEAEGLGLTALPEDSWFVGRLLRAFADRTYEGFCPHFDYGEDNLYRAGRTWVLAVATDHKDETAGHWIALHRTSETRTLFVDTTYRKPTARTTFIKGNPHRRFRVGAGWALVENETEPAPMEKTDG